MNKFQKIALALGAMSLIAIAPAANAIPITDFVNPTDTTITSGAVPTPCPLGFTCTTSNLSFVHDITDNGFALGDTINSATVAIHLTEQAVTGPNHETYLYNIGTQTFTCSSGNCVPNGGVTDNITFNSGSLADLQADGKIGIQVSSTSGSFLFADSLLTAQVTPSVNQNVIPEPSTLLLFGLGLLGIAASRRKSAGNNRK